MTKRTDTTLVLKEETADHVRFAHRSRWWGTIAAVVGAGSIGACLLFGAEIRALNDWLFGLGWILGVTFLLSAVYSWTTRRSLLIRIFEQEVHFEARDLFGSKKWTKPFDEFVAVRLFRPAMGSSAEAPFVRVLLVTQDGEELPLRDRGPGEPEWEEARDLARRIAEAMSIPIDDETSSDAA